MNNTQGAKITTTLLSFATAYLLKLVSSHRKQKATSIALEDVLHRLGDGDEATAVATEHFLATCVVHVSSFAASFKKALVAALVARDDLAPSATCPAAVVEPWLKAAKKPWALLGCIDGMLHTKGAGLAQLVDVATKGGSGGAAVVAAMWPSLWAHGVGARPTQAGKKLALALVLSGDVVGSSFFTDCAKVRNAVATSVAATEPVGGSAALHCEGLMALCMVAEGDPNATIAADAAHALVAIAPTAIAAASAAAAPVALGSAVLRQRPLSVWSAVVRALAFALHGGGGGGGGRKGNKSASHKVLTAIVALLDLNPFARAFGPQSTAQRAEDVVHDEMAVAAGAGEDGDDDILFLRQELAFVAACHASLHPALFRFLEHAASFSGLAQRDVVLVERILMSDVAGLDPTAVVTLQSRLPPGPLRDSIDAVMRHRCLHSDAFLKMASSGGAPLTRLAEALATHGDVAGAALPIASLLQTKLASVSHPDALTAAGLDAPLLALSAILRATESLPTHDQALQPARRLAVKCCAHVAATFLPLDGFPQHLSRWLHLTADVAADLPQSATASIREACYPHLLLHPVVMPAAVPLSLHLTPTPSTRFLYECIATLQDTLDSDSLATYVTLLGTAVAANAALIRKQGGLAIEKPDGDGDGDSDSVAADYMADSTAKDAQEVAKEAALDAAVGPGSFLACFLPMVLSLTADGTVPESTRVVAVRTLGAYLACSGALLREHIGRVESIIADSDGAPAGLRSEAVAVLYDSFRPSTSSVLCVVRALVAAFSARRSPASSALFVRVALRCVHQLLLDDLVRDPAEVAVALALPFAFTGHNDHTLADELLSSAFARKSHLVPGAVYQLCMPTSSSSSSSSSTSLSISRFIADEVDARGRLGMVGAIINLGKRQATLIDGDGGDDDNNNDNGDEGDKSASAGGGLFADVDLALTRDVLRTDDVFVSMALTLFDPPDARAVEAIRMAKDAGNLPPVTAKELMSRLVAKKRERG